MLKLRMRWASPASGIALTIRIWIVIVTVVATLAIGGLADAQDRYTARFRKLLLGRHDAARLTALRSVKSDFQSRNAVLPLLIEALEKLADDPRFDRAAKLGQPDLPDGVRMMMEIVASVDADESTDLLVQLLDNPRATWSMASMQALCKFQHHDAIDDLLELMESDSFERNYGYRFALARGLKDMKHPDAWDGLAKLFDRVDGQLAHRLEQEFSSVTAEAFSGDVQRFEQWQRSVGITPVEEPVAESTLARAVQLLKDDGDPEPVDLPMPEKKSLSPPKSASSYARERKLTPSKYYGIEIYAKRLLFIIDRSGSMNQIVYGQTRIQKAKRELITAISGLDERCEFSVLVFDTEIRAWRTDLVQATDENKRDAAQYVSKLAAGSSTNTYGALRMGIEFDPQLEAIFLLTDGQPTAGPIVHPSGILLDILARNELHHITINSIAIAVEPTVKNFLRKLTEPSGGDFRDVR